MLQKGSGEQIDIYLTETGDSNTRFIFPSLPESIKIKGAAKYQNYDILNVGSIKLPKGTEVGSISWEGTFFGKSKKRESIVRNFKAPKSCVRILENWRDNGTILILLATTTSINYKVTIASFDGEEAGAFGSYKYSITFNKHKEIKISTTSELNISTEVPQKITEIRPEPAPKAGDLYTVVSGDNLWSIANRKLGNGARWQELYQQNRDVIEAEAIRHGKKNSDNGHWIWAGTKLTLPAV